MKSFSFDLDRFQIENLFRPFREKSNVILFWMEAIKLITTYVPPSPEDKRGIMILKIDKMRRIIVHTENKAFSASFPFSIYDVDGVLAFHLRSGIEVSSRISSEVISILTSAKAFENEEALGLLDDLEQTSGDPDSLWRVLGELVQADDGYVRLDHDPDRENGDLHPLNHLDIFYSQSATFKIGLRRKYEADQLLDMLDIKSNCSFVEGK